MTDPRPELEFRAELLEFIARPVYPYLVTTTQAGAPYLRPVICVNDGFQVRMITRAASRKVTHIRRNPLVSLFWASGEGSPPRSVMLQAEVSLLEDPESIEAFNAAYRLKNPARTRSLPSGDEEIARVVLVARPRLLRADGFRGFRPIILRADELTEGGPA
jgi:nitroimidazol reductase NimA-like FMN-containing flavoprotein (pyridoxamine 5'-phosphate oxidase superfamily)